MSNQKEIREALVKDLEKFSVKAKELRPDLTEDCIIFLYFFYMAQMPLEQIQACPLLDDINETIDKVLELGFFKSFEKDDEFFKHFTPKVTYSGRLQ